MEIQFVEKEQVWQDATTRYWFTVDGAEWALADQAGDLTLLNADGYPVESCNDHDGLLDALSAAYVAHNPRLRRTQCKISPR